MKRLLLVMGMVGCGGAHAGGGLFFMLTGAPDSAGHISLADCF